MKSLFSAIVICCLLVVGCGDSDSKNKSAPKGDAVDWEDVLSNWKSGDGATRLAIIENHDSLPELQGLTSHFKGKAAEELVAVLGEPNAVEKSNLTGEATFRYFMGTTTAKTPYKEKDILRWVIDKEGIVKDMSIQLKKFHSM